MKFHSRSKYELFVYLLNHHTRLYYKIISYCIRYKAQNGAKQNLTLYFFKSLSLLVGESTDK